MSRLRDERGFSVGELLVAMTLATVVFGAAVSAFTGFVDTSGESRRRSVAQDGVRTAVDRIALQARSAMSPGGTTHPIELQSNYDLVFLAPVDGASLVGNPRGLAHVRFCLDTTAGRLWRQSAPYATGAQAAPPSTSACPSPAWARSDAVAADIVNHRGASPVPLFSVTADAGGRVTDLAVRALVDPDPDKGVKAADLRTKVTLRNANRPPTAMLNCQGFANGNATCDASASVDPDGELLSYAWKMDGGALTEKSSRLSQTALAAGSTHSFTVTVTDSGGHSESATKSVTIP